ncbi:hypothetical protein GGR56DRAFT_488551 [Xylariaceae sp. FL0804]|nr:hypothetical protein GGR56DRAFT_488551 [Xylariaceae sp. FL0804]
MAQASDTDCSALVVKEVSKHEVEAMIDRDKTAEGRENFFSPHALWDLVKNVRAYRVLLQPWYRPSPWYPDDDRALRDCLIDGWWVGVRDEMVLGGTMICAREPKPPHARPWEEDGVLPVRGHLLMRYLPPDTISPGPWYPISGWRTGEGVPAAEPERPRPDIATSRPQSASAKEYKEWQNSVFGWAISDSRQQAWRRSYHQVLCYMNEKYPHLWFIRHFVVEAPLRRRGVGRRILQAALAHVSAGHVVMIFAEQESEPAYAALGFTYFRDAGGDVVYVGFKPGEYDFVCFRVMTMVKQ